MLVAKYKIKRIATPEIDQFNQWQITMDLTPTWLERFVFSAVEEHKTMVGSCIHWTWGDGTNVPYLWSCWAQNAIKRRVRKAGGTTYVNRRLDRQKDKRDTENSRDNSNTMDY